MLIAAAALAQSIGTASSSQAVETRSACILPRLPRDGRLVVLRMSGGDAVSTLAVAGLKEGTTTGEIRIGSGRGKLQLAIVSNDPVVVRLTGQVARLSDVVMVNRAGAGVTGVPALKVHFSVGARCDLPIDPTAALGKTPVISQSISGLYKGWTDGRRFRHQEIHAEYGRAKTKLAEKMDWLHPGGVVDIEPSKVASSRPVVRYSVLPDLAGALQLEQSGALVEATPAEIDAWTAKAKVHHGTRLIDQVKIGRDGPFYRVTRPIQVPVGLCGAQSLNFLVPSPDYLSGDPCHAEILQLDGHILAPSWYIVDPDCGLAAFEALARPHAPGPLTLRTIHCLISQPARGDSSVPMVSPDARYMTFFPNSDKRLRLQVWDIAGTEPLHDYAVTSSHYGNLTLWQWPGSPPTYQWSEDSAGIWAAKPVSDTETGSGPLKPIFVRLDGSIKELPDFGHPAGPFQGLRWVGGRGRAIARFRDSDPYDRTTKKLLPFAYGMVDGSTGAVLDDFESGQFERLRQSNPGLKDFLYAEKVVAAQREDGRLQALMDLGRWVLWTQGEAPRVVQDLPRASGAVMSTDGKTVLMMRPNLPGQDNSEIRVFCEDNGEDERPCFQPDRREGTWASFHDVETGRLLWGLAWQFDRHDLLQNFTLSPDGRFALVTLPFRTDPNKMLVAVVSMSEGRIVQTLARPHGDFSMGFASGGKVAWVLTSKATILYEVD